MGFLDRIFGRDITSRDDISARRTDDEIAVERYQYLLRTAAPKTIEEVHIDAFSKLTPAQLDLLFDELMRTSPARDDRPADASAESLARTATRTELTKPGTLTRTFGEANRRGNGGLFGFSLLDTIATYAITSAVISPFFWTGFGIDTGGYSAESFPPEETSDAARGEHFGAHDYDF